jgi:hypothetical protein
MSAQGFTHPHFGSEVRIEQYDREVHLVFVAGSPAQSASLVEMLLSQLKDGALNLTLMGKPTGIEETP